MKYITKYLILLSTISFFTSCQVELNIGCISPEGTIETRTFEFNDFDKVVFELDAEVVIRQGETQEVVIESNANILDRIEDDSQINGDELVLAINGCSKLDREDVKISITMKAIESIIISGDAVVDSEGTWTDLGDLDLSIEGDGTMNIDFNEVNEMVIQVDGDGEFNLTGIADELKVDLSGDAILNTEGLNARKAAIKIEGDADCELTVSEEIDIDVKGDGTLEIWGTADEQKIDVSGDASIRNFELISQTTKIRIQGDANCEVTVEESLTVEIRGDGSICYRGQPSLEVDVGSGSISDCN